uniref:UDP-GlcNAc:betaGal beta-1,3-N-acetylglucosaminyltransferase like 1 n=1 Tax=Equus caballus TaxID=9796 RepID=A0A9L0TJQ4_HORSE
MARSDLLLLSPVALLQIIGCQVRREPPNSTERYTRWINQLASDQLLTQVFTSHGPTVVMPTWFCSREWFSHVGPFDEGGQGVPEDLLFFYSHLRKGGGVVRVDQSLLIYRYHPKAATHSVLETTIWTHRVRFLEERALPHWAAFTIWNAGRQGRRLYRSLTAESRRKVGPPSLPSPRSAVSPSVPEAGVLCPLRWSPSVMWTRTRSRRASTPTRTQRCVGPPGRALAKLGVACTHPARLWATWAQTAPGPADIAPRLLGAPGPVPAHPPLESALRSASLRHPPGVGSGAAVR